MPFNLISGNCFTTTLELQKLHTKEFTTQTMVWPSWEILATTQAIIHVLDCRVQEPCHAQDTPCNLIIMAVLISSFRQETYQLYYRNDPVKYNLTINVTLFLYCTQLFSMSFWFISVLYLHCKYKVYWASCCKTNRSSCFNIQTWIVSIGQIDFTSHLRNIYRKHFKPTLDQIEKGWIIWPW